MKRSLLLLFFLSSIAVTFAQDGFEHLKHIPGCFLPPEADSGFWWSDRGGLHTPWDGWLPDTPLKPAPIAVKGLPVEYLSAGTTLHFLSPQPIQYVDISAKSVEGDLAMKNLLRIRVKDGQTFSGAVVTIAGQDFIAQYQVLPGTSAGPLMVEVRPGDTRPIDMSPGELTTPQLKELAMRMLLNRAGKHREKTNAYDITATLNHVFTLDEYIFLDLGYRNASNLKYNIEGLRFTIEDKKVTKATNIQSIDVKPELSLLDIPAFKNKYRNIFVFRKFTYPGNKVLKIQLTEKQLSGRVIDITIPYKDILEADVLTTN
ncbi:MAG: DUF4138 domain-containing protein [Bacteroidetes bacterium]|nr:DUF4138 domain-containing protein [Bacteroidota bacterium]